MKQKEALDILKMGENVFLTGPAGTGKTFLLTEYIDYLHKNNIAVAVTASTGIAATHLGGRTIHSWCGMGIEESLDAKQIKALKKKSYIARNIVSTRVLIIDEISMLSAKQLDLVDAICKAFKENEKPFGGIQVIFSGDFFQLPPVKRGDKDSRFVVDSVLWNNMDLKICYLDQQYRQRDRKFSRVLKDIRENTVSDETLNILEKRINKPVKSKIKPTKLHTHNVDVDIYNQLELAKIEDKDFHYEMEGEGLDKLVESLKKGYCLAPQRLILKVGAIVMFVKNNFNKGYVNGTLGRIIDFDQEDGYPVVETFSGDVINASPEQWIVEDGKEIIASVKQVPLRLAWAITVHKSQGMSLDAAEIDLSKTFEYGMGYVALSRVRSLSGVKLMGFNEMALKARDEVIAFDQHLHAKSDEDMKKYKKIGRKKVLEAQKEFLTKNREKIFHRLFE